MITLTKREALLKKISTYQFAAHDLQLYLDTHPEDKETVEQMRRYKNLAKPLIEQYEDAYGMLTKSNSSGNNWEWIKAPWPWESEDEC